MADEYDRIKKMLDAKQALFEPTSNLPNLTLTTEERYQVYNDVLAMLRGNEEHRDIAQHVVVLLNQFIAEKMTKAKKRAKGKSPIFKRVDAEPDDDDDE